jgi:hypothetical protein
MDTLGDILPRMMKSMGLGQRYKSEMIILNWRQIVGGEIAANTRLRKISRRVLTLSAKNAVWAHHLTTLKEEIIAKINAFAGEKAVTDLKFQAGYLRNDQNEEKDDDEPITVARHGIKLDCGEARTIEEMAAPLADDLLRVKMKRLLGKEMTLRKLRRGRDWQPCRQCGVLRPPDVQLCVACAAVNRAAGREAAMRLLRDAPWLGYEECARYVACRRSDYGAARDQLADYLMANVARDENDSVSLSLLAMLLYRVEPHQLTEDMKATTLEKVRRKSNVSASRR